MKRYMPALLPDDISRGKLGECFDTCIMIATENRKYKYVEGYASPPGTKVPILHAWLTDGEHAFDPTWDCFNQFGERKPIPATYIGMEMDTDLVIMFMRKTGYQGIIANHFRAPKLAQKVFKKPPLVIASEIIDLFKEVDL